MRCRPFLLVFLHLVLTVFSASGAIAASVPDEPSRESKLKAAYLLNFTKFITWPNSDATSKQTRICLQDRTHFEYFFKRLVADRNMYGNKRKIVVRRLSNGVQCDLTYLHNPRKSVDPTIRYGLIVLDSAGIPENEAAIVFYISNRKLRFEIDVDRVAKEGVVVSSELLKLARIR